MRPVDLLLRLDHVEDLEQLDLLLKVDSDSVVSHINLK